MRRAHRALAVILALFLALHLGNHISGLWGQETHRAVQEALRTVYRYPPVELLLLAAIAAQVALGIALVHRRRRVTLQSVSGACLALFLCIHLGAVLSARAAGTETDLAFAAAGLHAAAPWPALFTIYYGSAVLAVFAHVSMPLSRRHPVAGRAVLILGGGLSLALAALLAGLVVPLTIPTAQIAAFP